MKTLIVIAVLLSAQMAFATDVCYLFERGSEHWQECKEQAAVNEKRMDEHKAIARESLAESSERMKADVRIMLNNQNGR